MNRKNAQKFGLAGLFAAALAAFQPAPAFPQDKLGTLEDLLPQSSSTAPRSLDGRIQLFDNILVHPMPVWSRFADGPAPAEQSRIRTSRKEGLYRMSMVPRGENFEEWDNLFSVVGHDTPGPGLRRQGATVANQFRALCSPANSQVYAVDIRQNRLIQLVVCGQYSRDRNRGQMAAIVTLRNETGMATLTRQWRTGPFQAQVISAWPVPKGEIDRTLGELSRARLLPAAKISQ